MSSATSAVHSLSLKTRGELWLARGLHLFYSLWPRRLEDCTAPAFVLHDIPAAQGISPPAPLAEPPVPIPPIVWAYWNGAAPPALIQRCLDNWQRTNQGFSLRILNETSVLDKSQKFRLRSVVHRIRNAPTGFVLNFCSVTEAFGWMPAASLHAPLTGCFSSS